jgi:hypothetical protein
MIFCEKIELKVYVNQHDSVSDIQTPSQSWFRLCFLHELSMSVTIQFYCTILLICNFNLSSFWPYLGFSRCTFSEYVIEYENIYILYYFKLSTGNGFQPRKFFLDM